MHSIAEVAKILGVHRQSIYRALDCPELAGHIHDTDKRKCIDDKGVEILRELLAMFVDNSQTVHKQSEQPTDKRGQTNEQILDTYTKSLEEQLVYLKNIITEKDNQINEKDRQINEKDRACQIFRARRLEYYNLNSINWL